MCLKTQFRLHWHFSFPSGARHNVSTCRYSVTSGSQSLSDYPVPSMARISVLKACCPWWVAGQRSVRAFLIFLPSYFHNIWHVTFKKLEEMKQCSSMIPCSWWGLGNCLLTCSAPPGTPRLPGSCDGCEVRVLHHATLPWWSLKEKKREKADWWSFLFVK